MTKDTTTYGAILGYVILRKREEAGMTRAQMCEKVQVSMPTWMRVERGESAAISHGMIRKISRVLRVSPGVLYQEADDASKKMEEAGVEVLDDTPEKMSPAAKIMVGSALAAIAAFVIRQAKK